MRRNYGLFQMGWANRTISWTKNVFIAVFAPSYEIEQVEKYRNATLEYDGDLVVSINFNNEKYEDVPRWLKDGAEHGIIRFLKIHLIQVQ